MKNRPIENSFRVIRNYNIGGSSITSLTFSPDGEWVACGTISQKVVFCRVTADAGPDSIPNRGIVVCWSPDSQYIASSIDERMMISIVEDGKYVRPFVGHRNAVLHMAFTPDGLTLASGGRDELKLFEVHTGRQLQDFHVNGIIRGLAITPDGRKIMAGFSTGRVMLWDISSKNVLIDLLKHAGEVRCLDMSRDGRRALTRSTTGELCVWNIEQGTVLNVIVLDVSIGDVSFTADSRSALCLGRDRLIQIEPDTGKIIACHVEDLSKQYLLMCSPTDSRCAVTVSPDGDLRVWQLGEA